MNNKNLVVLSENELENISGGVNKKALGDAVEYGTAAVSTVVLSVVGQLLGFGVHGKFSYGLNFFGEFNNPYAYVPGMGILSAVTVFIGSIVDRMNGKGINDKEILGSAEIFTLTVGGGVGGWFTGRAIGKKIRKKLGL